jgi:alpha-beta hydrolase superfamily lysophospholipase
MHPSTTTPAQVARFLTRPEGRIGYDVAGTGPLVILVPGMSDLRSAYRFIAPTLSNSGVRVVCTDLRGHGDSDPTFPPSGGLETAGEITVLIEETRRSRRHRRQLHGRRSVNAGSRGPSDRA